jgi:hypothetical protein
MTQEKAPDFTIANNPHAFVHCGPVGPEGYDDGRDFSIVTASNNHCVWHSNGYKVEHIQKGYHEVSGHTLDVTKKEEIARSIIAKNGDLVINAERGTIYLKAKNIHLETTGDKKEGNFLVSSNGLIILSSTQEVRLAGSRVCLTGTSGINIVSSNFINLYGKMNTKGPVTLKSIQTLLSGGWVSLVEGLSKSCGEVEIV